MMLTTKGRYAIMAMTYMASLKDRDIPCTLAEISENQHITISYLEQIFARLRKSGIVKAVKGPGGGYVIARDCKDIYLSEIIEAAEESIKMTRCSDKEKIGCMISGTKCLTHNLWDGLTKHIENYFKSISLYDIQNPGKLLVNIKGLTEC